MAVLILETPLLACRSGRPGFISSSFSDYATLGRLFNFSEPQFLYLQNGERKTLLMRSL